MASHVAEAFISDCKLRVEIGKITRDKNAGTIDKKTAKKLIRAERTFFAQSMQLLGAARAHAVTVLKGMPPDLAVSKVTMAVHYVDTLFVSPLDMIEDNGGKRATVELFKAIDHLVDELNVTDEFAELVRPTGWFLEAVQRARDRHPELNKLIPGQAVIEAHLSQSRNSVSGFLRFQNSLAKLQQDAYSDKTLNDKVENFLGEANVLANAAVTKAMSVPQTVYDIYAGVERRGQDIYCGDVKLEKTDPISIILGCPELARSIETKKNYGSWGSWASLRPKIAPR